MTVIEKSRGASPGVVVGVVQAGIGYLLASLGPCLVLLARDLSVPLGALSWLSAGFGAGLLVFGILGERLLGRGSWRVLGTSAASLGVGGMLLGLANGIGVAKAGALLLGLGGAGVVLACWAVLSGPDAGRALTHANAASSLAGIGAPPLMGLLDAATGRGRLALLLPVPALAWVAYTSWVAGRTAPVAADRPEATSQARAPRWLLARRWTCIVAAVSAEFGFVVWGAARLQASGLSPSAAAAWAVAFPIGMGVGRLVAPRLPARVPVIEIGVALAIASALLAVAPVPPVLAILALGGAGFGIAPLFPLTLARFVGSAGLSAGRAASMGTAASGVAVLGAPVLLHAIAEHTSLRAGFLFVVAVLALLAVLQAQRDPAAHAAREGTDARSSG